MRWPFGPPHLTLKPSKKNTKKTKQKTTQKNQKETKTKKEKVKNTKIPKKSFSVISQNFLSFWQGIQKLPFLTPWPRKRAPKNTIKTGVSACFFGKKLCVTKRPFLDKKTQIQKFQLLFFLAFFSFSKTKNTRICWNPYFYSVLANLKKENFPKINLKHRNLKNPIFAPIFWKRLFLDNCQIIGHKRKH